MFISYKTAANSCLSIFISGIFLSLQWLHSYGIPGARALVVYFLLVFSVMHFPPYEHFEWRNLTLRIFSERKKTKYLIFHEESLSNLTHKLKHLVYSYLLFIYILCVILGSRNQGKSGMCAVIFKYTVFPRFA